MAVFSDLPPEITNAIIDEIPLSSLAALRHCWRHLNESILPRLFRTIHITFAEKHLERLQAVCDAYAPLVQELAFITSQTRDTHKDVDGHVHTDAQHEEYARDYRCKFLACVDTLPNLHTFTSELGPISSTTAKEEIDGLVYAIMPALCRPSSHITTLRCQDPLNYIRWLESTIVESNGSILAGRPPLTMMKSLPQKCFPGTCSCKRDRKRYSLTDPVCVRNILFVRFINGRVCRSFPWDWASALKGLVKLDLQTDTAGGEWRCQEIVGDMLFWFLEAAVHLRELSVRWRHTGQDISGSRPLVHSGWQLEHIFDGRWNYLRTIKLTGVRLTFGGKPLMKFIRRHARTLRHIMLHNVRGDPDVVRVIEYAASNPEVHLHRFAVFPAYESHQEDHANGMGPHIVPEELVLDYINSRPQRQNPFELWKPSGFEYWGTIDQKAESLSIKWPQNNGMPLECRQCKDK